MANKNEPHQAIAEHCLIVRSKTSTAHICGPNNGSRGVIDAVCRNAALEGSALWLSALCSRYLQCQHGLSHQAKVNISLN